MNTTPKSPYSGSSDSSPGLDYVVQRYESTLKYYWESSKQNRLCYKSTRYVTIVLGAVVTLIASLSSAKFIADAPAWDAAFAVATPVLAAILTISAGFSQSFQWGAAWRDMVLNAERVASELDRIRVLPAGERDPVAELGLLNTLVLNETTEFFERTVGRARPADGDLPSSPPATPA